MELELSLVSSYKFPCKDPNLMIRSKQQPNRFVIFGQQDTLMFELKNCPDSIELINFEFQYAKTPEGSPLAEIIKNKDMLSIYNNATALEKQSITLSHLYASEFVENPVEIHIVNLCWPDPTNYSDKMDVPAAKLTNFGQLNIYTQGIITHDCDIFQLNINEVLHTFDSNIKTRIIKFKDLKLLIDNYFITSCCWEPLFRRKINTVPTEESLLFCSTASGLILGITVWKYKAKLEFSVKTNLYKINCLETFRVESDNNFYLIASDINGLIKLFTVDKQNYNITEVCSLWNTVDKIASSYFHVNYINNKIIIATTKASHFVVFLINCRNELLVTKLTYCGTIITGFDKVSLLNDYIISTKNGIIRYVQVHFQGENNIEIEMKKVKLDLVELENYQIIGLLSTSNFVGWIFVLVPRSIIANDPNIKYPLILSFHQLNNIDPISILTSYKSLNMNDYVDCNEIIRVKIQRDQLVNNYYKFSILPIEISKEFLHRLRIRLMITYALSGYNLKKMKTRGENYEIEINDIKILITTLSSYFRIKYITATYTDLSYFQMLTIKCARRNLINYLQNDKTSIAYLAVKTTLQTEYEKMINDTEKLIIFVQEICYYCNEDTDNETSISGCVHNFLKCCVSFVQIKTMEMKHCQRCKSVALDNEDQLYEVSEKNEDILCPFCNYILVNSGINL